MLGGFIMAIRKTFSFRKDIAEWIDKHGRSKYLTGLVLADMEGGDYVTKREVIRLIEDKLSGVEIKSENRIMDEDFKKGIMNLVEWK
jgi:hypothetical protein